MGGEMLAEAWPYLPTGVHLALVDPFTATHARGIAVALPRRLGRRRARTTGSPPGPGRSRAASAEAYELAEPRLWAKTPSRSFRGRDVFAPVTAHLANGVPLAEVGPPLDPDVAGASRGSASRPCTATTCTARSAMVDHFGNLALNMRRSDLEAAGIQLGDTVELRCGGRTLEVPFTLTLRRGAGRAARWSARTRSAPITIAVNGGRADRELRASRASRWCSAGCTGTSARPPTKVSVVDGPPS